MNKGKIWFTIKNDTNLPMTIVHEPECFEFEVPISNEIVIETDPVNDSINLKIDVIEGKTVVSIWPHRSMYSVYHNGNDVFGKYFD